MRRADWNGQYGPSFAKATEGKQDGPSSAKAAECKQGGPSFAKAAEGKQDGQSGQGADSPGTRAGLKIERVFL